jgi:DNA helicase-2/ATP-dependent DNA helicase PcrA
VVSLYGMNKDFLKDLNKEQLAAVKQKDGPMIILAGAGSGKTRVLTYKVINLIKEGIDPDNILMVTFTNKAASEMKERMQKFFQKDEINRLIFRQFQLFMRFAQNSKN